MLNNGLITQRIEGGGINTALPTAYQCVVRTWRISCSPAALNRTTPPLNFLQVCFPRTLCAVPKKVKLLFCKRCRICVFTRYMVITVGIGV